MADATTRTLALFFDGSWCTRRARHPSAVARLYEAARAAVAASPPGGAAPRLFHADGVGTTGLVRRLVGGATGQGLSEIVRDGYRFLSRHVVDPATTRIILVGYSRGAFTARALAGFLGASGLLAAEHCTDAGLARAWAHYRTPPAKRSPAERVALGRMGREVRVAALGVFETVGSLGIPTVRAGQWAGARPAPLGDRALHWMARRLGRHALVFDLPPPVPGAPGGPIGPSPAGLWRLAGPARPRAIAGLALGGGVTVPPGEHAWREAVHVSVLERVVETGGIYRPPGLVAALGAIERGRVPLVDAGGDVAGLIAAARSALTPARPTASSSP